MAPKGLSPMPAIYEMASTQIPLISYGSIDPEESVKSVKSVA
jgi:hypothetical protein